MCGIHIRGTLAVAMILLVLVMLSCNGDKGTDSTSSAIVEDVYALAIYKGDLIAAGAFGEFDKPSHQVKRLIGFGWETIDTTIGGSCHHLCVGDSGLFATGTFTTIGGVPANHIARWNGTSWQALGTGIEGGTPQAMVKYNEHFVVAGQFTTAGGNSVNNLGAWHEATSTWTTFGSVPFWDIKALAIRGGILHAAGSAFIGNTWYQLVMRWTGASWEQNTSANNSITALGNAPVDVFAANNVLVVGGGFDSLGGQPVNGIAYTVGDTVFHPLGNGLTSTHTRKVCAITEYNNDLIVGGTFETAGGAVALNIARWDGAWHAMGAGLPGLELNCLVVYNGVLIAGGSFTDSRNNNIGSIARWNGTSWAIEKIAN